MKNAGEHIARKGFMLQQFLRRASGIKRLRGRHPNAPAPSSVMPERGRPGNALGAVLSLTLLLFALLGLLAAITGAYALTPKQLSASSLAGRPTKTPPPRRSSTPTTVPSPTATATSSAAPSPTFMATPTTRATVPASVAPHAKATTPSASGKPGGGQRPTPVSTPSTSSPSSPAVQQQEGDAFFPLVILSGIAAVALLVAVGLWLLRQWLMPFYPPLETVFPPEGILFSHEPFWAKLAVNEADAAVLGTNQGESHPYERHASSSPGQQCNPSQAEQPANGTHE